MCPLKSKDKFRSSTISMAKAAVLQMEKTDGSKLDDNQVIEVLAKEVKQRRDAMQEFENGKRQDVFDEAKAEIKILLKYLPQQLTESEISELVRETVVELGTNSMKHMEK